MKLSTIVFFLLSICWMPDVQAKANLRPVSRTDKTVQLDSTRAEFNLKKKSTAFLVLGKSPDAILAFYEFYLEEKDLNRADSLLLDLLKSTPAVAYRYQASLISYGYTSDAKTKLLFLSDPERIQEYRAYFLKSKASALKSNGSKLAHYYNLVALDAAEYKINPDSLLRKQMGDRYNSLAWYSLLTQKLNDVDHYLDQSIRFNPKSKYPYANRPLYLLLKGRYKQAESLYITLKDQSFDSPSFTFKDEFLEDFKELAAVGIVNRDIDKIILLLNQK